MCAHCINYTQKVNRKYRNVNCAQSSSDFGSLLRISVHERSYFKCVDAVNGHLGFEKFLFHHMVAFGWSFLQVFEKRGSKRRLFWSNG